MSEGRLNCADKCGPEERRLCVQTRGTQMPTKECRPPGECPWPKQAMNEAMAKAWEEYRNGYDESDISDRRPPEKPIPYFYKVGYRMGERNGQERGRKITLERVRTILPEFMKLSLAEALDKLESEVDDNSPNGQKGGGGR